MLSAYQMVSFMVFTRYLGTPALLLLPFTLGTHISGVLWRSLLARDLYASHRVE